MLPPEIAQSLERGALVVTANRRAAHSLRIACDRQNRAQGLTSWRPANVLSWEAWTNGLWHRLLIDGHVSLLLMNRVQEQDVWQQIIAADEASLGLRTEAALAEMAAETWSLLCSYNGQQKLRGTATNSDTRAFQRWAAKFEGRCKIEGWLSHAQLEDTLRAFVQAGKITVAETGIALAGFDSFTPAQTALLQQLTESGAIIEQLHPEIPPVRRALTLAQDEHEELRAAAAWARCLLEQKPDARVAFIVPSLEKQRSEIDRIFRDILAPELQDIAATNAGPFEFSIGTMLAKTPLAATALTLLRWISHPLPIEQVSALLLSPYFAAGQSELASRAEFDAFDLRQATMLRPEISLDWLIATIERSERRPELSDLNVRLHTLRAAAGRLLSGDDQRLASDWAERMRKLLEAAAWGRGNGEDSVEFQAHLKWHSALDELATLDLNGTRIQYAEALDTLEQIARKTMFTPESREAPVQIMGPLEAAGSSFDAIWFLRCGDLSWPPPQSSNPLLSWRLQRELKMAGSDAELDAEQARRAARRIAESAETVIFSYASECESGKQRSSPALNDLPLEAASIAEFAAGQPSRPVIELQDAVDPAKLPPLPDQIIRGGAEILRLQAACGFRAFAERRLRATDISSVATGMDAAERGTIVHLVLEAFWNKVRTQQTLKEMPARDREALLDECISAAVFKAAGYGKTSWDAAYLDMQRERLRHLLRPWLGLELARSPFTVLDRERKLEDKRIGPLRLNVRVDRIDVGEHGDIIIDYKTGSADPKDWLSERPDAPQLPLYAVLNGHPLEAVALAQIRAGKDMGLKGFTAEKLEGVTTSRKNPQSLEEQVSEWRRVLTSLAESFSNGDARVNPKSYPTTCTYCAQRLLCRLDLATLEREIDDENETETEHG